MQPPSLEAPEPVGEIAPVVRIGHAAQHEHVGACSAFATWARARSRAAPPLRNDGAWYELTWICHFVPRGGVPVLGTRRIPTALAFEYTMVYPLTHQQRAQLHWRRGAAGLMRVVGGIAAVLFPIVVVAAVSYLAVEPRFTAGQVTALAVGLLGTAAAFGLRRAASRVGVLPQLWEYSAAGYFRIKRVRRVATPP